MPEDETRNVNGYAPLGYPQPQPLPPQQGYGHPYPGYAIPYNATVPPQGTAYYSSAQLPNNPSEPTKGYTFARVALILTIALIVGSLALSISTWLVFGTRAPVFKVEEFSVPYFNIINDSTLMGRWETNVTAHNPSHKIEFFLADIEGILLYRDNVVDFTMIDSLHLGMNGEGSMRANFSVGGPDQRKTSDASGDVVREMDEGRKSGSVKFDLRMIMEVRFSSAGTLWRKRSVLRVLCEDILVNFSSPTGEGTWNGATGECVTYL